jgi:hypothetical protein
METMSAQLDAFHESGRIINWMVDKVREYGSIEHLIVAILTSNNKLVLHKHTYKFILKGKLTYTLKCEGDLLEVYKRDTSSSDNCDQGKKIYQLSINGLSQICTERENLHKRHNDNTVVSTIMEDVD